MSLSRKSFFVNLIVVICLALSACKSSFVKSEHSPTPSPSIATTVIETPFVTSTAMPITVSPTAHILSKEEAIITLTNLLKTNAGCQLPCWWGITPGVSSPSNAYSTLVAFQNIAYTGLLYPNSGVVDIKYFEEDLFIPISVGFLPNLDGQTVKSLKIFTLALKDLGNRNYEDAYDSSVYNDLLGSYFIDGILSRYGRPSQVLVRADLYNNTQRETFEITLLYPKMGIFVRYNSLAERIDDKIRGCPTKAFIELWLLSPDDKDSYQTILSTNDETWEGNFPYSKPVEDAVSMTVEEFYQTFREPTENCLETHLKIWPEH